MTKDSIQTNFKAIITRQKRPQIFVIIINKESFESIKKAWILNFSIDNTKDLIFKRKINIRINVRGPQIWIPEIEYY